MSFGFRGDPSWLFNFPRKPLLNPIEAFFFWIGVGIAIWRWKERPAGRLLLLWLGVLLLPAILSRSDNSPHFLRMNGVVPAVYLLTGVGVWEVFRFLRQHYFRQSGLKLAVVLAGAAGCLILVQGMATYRTYFDKWAVEPELTGFYSEGSKLAEALNALPSSPDTAILIPRYRRRKSFDYLYQGHAPAYDLNPHSPNLEQDVATVLSRMEKIDTLKVVEWKAGYVGVWEDTGRFGFLLKKHGVYQNSEEYEHFHLHTLTALSQRRPWTFYEYLEPLTIEYDGGIATQGLALGQGDNQSSSQELLDLTRNRPLWMAIQWKTVPGLDVDYAISLRLYNEEGEIAHQEDSVLWSRIHSPTRHWSAGQSVDTLVMLDIPSDLPFGEYELRLVVYNFETQAPTVQIDVWEPETTLARLRLTEGG